MLPRQQGDTEWAVVGRWNGREGGWTLRYLDLDAGGVWRVGYTRHLGSNEFRGERRGDAQA